MPSDQLSIAASLRPANGAALRLEVRGLGCVRGGRQVFDNLSFDVTAGEALAVTGRNGAGKTSLLRLVAGLLQPEAGTIALVGGADDTALGEQAHYLGHRDPLKPSLTARENLAFWRDFLGQNEDRGDLDGVLRAVGLDHAADLPAGYLSAGQRRRLSFARLIAVRRPLWLLDEPTSALDASGQALVAELMTAHLATGGLILAATHGPLGIDAKELRMADR